MLYFAVEKNIETRNVFGEKLTYTPKQNQRKHDDNNNEEECKSSGIPPVNAKPFL